MRFLSLFSGIGAHDLGLQRASMTITGQCEIDPFARAVLEKHWPGVPRFEDVRDVTAQSVRERCGDVQLVTGGFPCQDVSVAGKGKGLGGERSGLWFEMLRVIREVGPDWLLIENVPALRSRGADIVLVGLEEAGYAVWPCVVGAWAIGAPHKRDRVWIVGHARSERLQSRIESSVAIDSSQRTLARRYVGRIGNAGDELGNASLPTSQRHAGNVLGEETGGSGSRVQDGTCSVGPEFTSPGERGRELADAESSGRKAEGQRRQPENAGTPAANAIRWPARPGQPQHEWEAPRLLELGVGEPVAKPATGLVSAIARARSCTDGEAEAWWFRNKVKVERRQNREALRCLGAANPPIVPEIIGRWIMSYES